MQITHDPADTAALADPEPRALVERTVVALSEDYRQATPLTTASITAGAFF
jgi:hypothetical protein